MIRTFLVTVIGATAFAATGFDAFAGSAAWNLNPVTGNWNSTLNWTPGTVPNGPADTATFNLSNTSNVSLSADTEVSEIVFSSAATNPYTVTANPTFTLTISGTGITNNSGITQTFVAAAGSAGNNGSIQFTNSATAGNATIAANGATTTGTMGGLVRFADTSSAFNATLIANAGSNGGGGGRIVLANDSFGDTPRVEVFGNGSLDVSAASGFTTVGSIEGNGNIFLGSHGLSIAGNGGREFSGVIQDGGTAGGTGGGLGVGFGGFAKLFLSGANTYTGNTAVELTGMLFVNNTTGSGTGSGNVFAGDGGTLGGTGKIAGAVTIGIPAISPPSHLSPGADEGAIGTLTIQGSLTIPNGILDFDLNSDTGVADKVIANGVMIVAGGGFGSNQQLFSFTDLGNTLLTPGSEFTVIDNTSALPIMGTFTNLLDGTLFTGGPNTFKVNYEGGDGNNLTLQVAGHTGNVPDSGTSLGLLGAAVSALAFLRRKIARH